MTYLFGYLCYLGKWVYFYSDIFGLSSSDEEEEDTDALLYLPVAPDIDEPEEGWPVVSENVSFNS